MNGAGSAKNMMDKAQECRDNSRSSAASRKRKFKSPIYSAKKNGRSYVGGVFMTIVIFAFLIFFGFKIMQSYHNYEIEYIESIPTVSSNKMRAYEQSMAFGTIAMENGYFEEALAEFENALRIIANDSMAQIKLTQSLDSLKN
jgi:hypothetical protein